MGDQERALGYADICDRPYLHENFMRPPSFIVKYSSDLCPNVLLRIRFRFLFSTLFFRDPPPFPTRETQKYGYRCRLLAVGFSPFFAITRRMNPSPEREQPRLSEHIARFQKARESNVLSFRRYASDILFVSIFSDLATFLIAPYALTAFFASEKCANACEAHEHPPSTQTPANPSFSIRCCDIAGSVYGPRLSYIRRRVR